MATPGSAPTAALDVPQTARCAVCGGALEAPSLSSHDRLYGTPGTFAVALCSRCGLGVTLPVVGEDDLPALYPKSYGAHEQALSGIVGLVSSVVQRVVFWRTLHTEPLANVAKLPAGRLLDVGCGRGDVGAQFVDRGWEAVGVEPSPEACTAARGRGLDARAGTLASVELEPGAYDVAVFRHSLEHVVDPVSDMRRTCEALRAGGVAIVSVPNFGCWQRRVFGRYWLHLDLPRHRHHFDEHTLRATLERAGFARVETCTSYCNPGLPASVQYALFGRCLFPSGWKLRIAMAACGLLGPLMWLLNRFVGDGDVLHAVAYKP
jgi:SAM-dependent methyltransferase